MKPAPTLPQVHLFVCANQRGAESPLGTGCGAAGDAVYDALKGEVAARREFQRVWVTKTHCLGLCPPKGASVAIYPKQAILMGATAADAPSIYARATTASESTSSTTANRNETDES